jgi:hypothetical protein
MNEQNKKGCCQQIADEEALRSAASLTDHSRLVADQHAREQGRAEALRFAAYQKAMAEQAGASIAARETRQRLVFEGVEATGDGGIRAVGYAQSRTFTRTEVLTILRTIKADTSVVAGKEALDRAIRVFEGME